MNELLWFQQPATQWEEALPIGNGSLGGMLYGGTTKEVICLNKDTLWSGKPLDTGKKEDYFRDGKEHLGKVREKILEEKYQEANILIEEHLLGDYGESYLPAGTVILSMEQGKISDYRRELSLATGLAKTSFCLDGNRIERTAFASCPAQAIILRQESEIESTVHISISSEVKHGFLHEQDMILLDGECPIHVEPDYMGDTGADILYASHEGIHFRAAIKVCTTDGKVTCDENGLHISSKNFTLYITIHDSFIDYCSKPSKEYKAACLNHMDKISLIPYEEHRESHRRDYQCLYNRASFQLDGNQEQLPTDKRIERFRDYPAEDSGLFALLFQYARYLTIAGSRENTQPMNLQGIWSHNLRAVWSSNYTVNINTQMNYWPTMGLNLVECQEPLERFVLELSKSGSITAKQLYDCKGWTCHHNVDLWRITTPVGGAWKGKGFSAVRNAMWPMGGAWLCRHLFEHYEYTLDTEFLREKAFPVLLSSAEFLLDWMTVGEDGKLLTVPSTSPENEFLFEGKPFAAGTSTAMDIGIARELFGNCLKSMEILNKTCETAGKLKNALEQLPDVKTNHYGGIREWSRDYEEAEVHHRHLSQLYELYPGETMPEELLGACENSLNRRGVEGTGWSIAWKACLWSRLGNSEQVYTLLKRLIQISDGKSVEYVNGGIYPNLFMSHPPFQIDANFGVTAAIMETLLQSTRGEIKILPALPQEWSSGSVKGIRAKYNLVFDIEWKDCALQTLKIRKGKTDSYHDGQEILLKYRGKIYSCILGKEEERVIGESDFQTI